MLAKGINGQLEFDGNNIIITRKGFVAIASHGLSGEKIIPLKSISSVQLKKPNLWTRGYIQFTHVGSVEPISGIDAASKDENSIIIAKKHYSDFETIRNAVIEAIASI